MANRWLKICARLFWSRAISKTQKAFVDELFKERFECRVMGWKPNQMFEPHSDYHKILSNQLLRIDIQLFNYNYNAKHFGFKHKAFASVMIPFLEAQKNQVLFIIDSLQTQPQQD